MADLKYLTRLAKEYPNQKAAKAELINLRAILALPKGTEYTERTEHSYTC